MRAAVAGGITTVGVMPNTSPPMDSPNTIRDLLERSRDIGLTKAIPIPCVSKGRGGRESVDFNLLHDCGADSFSDDGNPVHDDRVLTDALKQTALFSGLVIEHPEVPLSVQGAVNSGQIAEQLNVGGIPESTETEDVRRCIRLLRNTGGRLHLTHLSSPESVKLAAAAKEEGLNVTCDVTPHHLALDESALPATEKLRKQKRTRRTCTLRLC